MRWRENQIVHCVNSLCNYTRKAAFATHNKTKEAYTRNDIDKQTSKEGGEEVKGGRKKKDRRERGGEKEKKRKKKKKEKKKGEEGEGREREKELWAWARAIEKKNKSVWGGGGGAEI